MSESQQAADGVVIVVGTVRRLIRGAAEAFPAAEIILVEDSAIIVQPGIAALIAELGVTPIPWAYPDDGTADSFYLRHRDLDVRAVVPGVEYGAVFAARLAERYGLPGATLGAAQLLRDKALLRAVTTAAGVHNPGYQQVDSLEQVRDFIRRHPGPVVIKPTNRQGAVGTRIVRTPEAAADAWHSAMDQEEAPYVANQSLPLRMLVEEFVEGTEYSVEMLLQGGESLFANVTGKLLHPGDRPVELGHVVPADVSSERWDALVAATRTVTDVVGFHTGVVHCEWIVRGDEPYLVECAGRMPGDTIMDLIEYAWPVELIARYISLLGGGAGERGPERPKGGAAVLYPAVPPGVVVSLDGVAEAKAVPGVFLTGVVVGVGDRVNELRSSWDRVIGAAASGASVEEAMRLVELALSKIRLVTEPAGQPEPEPLESVG